MMKLGERVIFIALCAVPTIFLLVLLYSELSYMKSLEIKFEVASETNAKLPNPKKVIQSDTKSMTGANSKMSVANKSKSKSRKNLFKDLHKYSLYNPNFRKFMEWPPFFAIPSHNPNLADIWNLTITPDLPNWKKFHYQISKLYLYEDSPLIEDLLHDIATKKIIAVDQHPGGTQFKLIVTFEDGGRALFKPQRYPKNKDMHENTLYFTDYERHVSEIAAFHLDRILGFRRAPPVVGRKVNVTGELYRLANEDYRMTFYLSPDGNYCFFGKCRLFCDEFHGFCGDPYTIEGSFAAYLPPYPPKLLDQRLITSPWRRTYLLNKKADWELNPHYCAEVVLQTAPFNADRRLYDVIDCAIFDYLIGNEDRHHYDEFLVFGNDSTLIHMDNGRGFGRAHHDEMSILMPLMQCCVMRLSTFNKLYSFHAGPRSLSDLMRESLSKDPVAPILTEPHLQSLDRRVNYILTTIRACIKVNRPQVVLLDYID